MRLSEKMNWEKLEVGIDVIYNEDAGQPPLLTRSLAGLHYLKYTFNESVVKRWVKKLYWPYSVWISIAATQTPLTPLQTVSLAQPGR